MERHRDTQENTEPHRHAHTRTDTRTHREIHRNIDIHTEVRKEAHRRIQCTHRDKEHNDRQNRTHRVQSTEPESAKLHRGKHLIHKCINTCIHQEKDNGL